MIGSMIQAEKISNLLVALISVILSALLIFIGNVAFLGMPLVGITIYSLLFFVIFSILITIAVFTLLNINPYIKVGIAGFLYPMVYDTMIAVINYFGWFVTVAGTLSNFWSDMFVALQSSVQGLIYSLILFALIKFILRKR